MKNFEKRREMWKYVKMISVLLLTKDLSHRKILKPCLRVQSSSWVDIYAFQNRHLWWFGIDVSKFPISNWPKAMQLMHFKFDRRFIWKKNKIMVSNHSWFVQFNQIKDAPGYPRRRAPTGVILQIINQNTTSLHVSK